MGFDIECVLNIQSLPGEYFCPVCRLLVYPNEALQSQCTHLYCKPCLMYIVSTTRACPYDGYLVTEADSKPLTETNKALAETIGKLAVHCLYYRSGCSWQGPLSECTSHCSGCAFGNSPVVCNRCGLQIVHRQVQEHAQNCTGVLPQAQHLDGAQDAMSSTTAVPGDQNQAGTQAGTTTSRAHTSQTTTSGQEPNEQASSTTPAQAAVPTTEQWYQQQQYQQSYQQYPGYDPYQQHYQQYYPYQQQAVPQYQQPQVYMQPQASHLQQQPQLQVQPQAQQQTQAQAQPHSHPNIQVPATLQTQNQAQAQPQQPIHSAVQTQSQIQPQALPLPHGHPHSQAPPNPQPQAHLVQPHPQHTQAPQYQQPHLQIQHSQQPVQLQQTYSQAQQPHVQQYLQSHSQPITSPSQPVTPSLQPQTQHPSVHVVPGHHSYPQQQVPQQMQVGAPQHSMHMHPQGVPQPLSQHPLQMQIQYTQHPPLLWPPQPPSTTRDLQQPGLLSSPGQAPTFPPAQPPYNAQQPGHSGHQHPVMQPVQPTLHQQFVQYQQPFPGQPFGPVQNQAHQKGPSVQSHIRPQSATQSFQQPSHAYSQPQQNVVLAHDMQPRQAQSAAGRPRAPLHGAPMPYPQLSVGMQLRPMLVGTNQQSGSVPKSNNQVPSDQQSGNASRPMPEKQGDGFIEKSAEVELSSQKTLRMDLNDLDLTAGPGVDAGETKIIKSESDLKAGNDENKYTGEAKNTPEPLATERGEPLTEWTKEELSDGAKDQTTGHEQPVLSVTEDKDKKDGSMLKTPTLQEAQHLQEQSIKVPEKTTTLQGSEGFLHHGQAKCGGSVLLSHSVPINDQGKQQPPLVPYGQTLLPGRSPSQPSPLAPGQSMNPPPKHVQQLINKQSDGLEMSPSGIPGSSSIFGSGPIHYGPQLVSYSQGHAPSSHAELPPPYGHGAEIFQNLRPNHTDNARLNPLGQHSSTHPNAMRTNGAPGLDSTSMLDLRDDRFRPPLPQDPAIIGCRELEGDLKHFPRSSHLESEPVLKHGSHFSSSRRFDGIHGFGMDMVPSGKGPHSMIYDSGFKLEPLAGPGPSKFFPPYHHDGRLHPNEIGERPVGFHDNIGRSDSGRTHPDFLGPGSRYGVRHMDTLAPRSPGRNFHGIPSREFGSRPVIDDIDGRESHRFGDPIDKSFHDNRFPVMPSHVRRGEFEGPGHLRMGDDLRSGDFIGQDGPPNHLRRGEHLVPRNLHSNMHLGDPVGFGTFPTHARMGEFIGPGHFSHPQIGEPGISSFSRKVFPHGVGSFTGALESFDNSRKRKPSSMGWCRICKVDCETTEGLDLHSQTREHQKMAMDMVITIKQNAKKQKLIPSDHSSVDDASKSRNASSEDQENQQQ